MSKYNYTEEDLEDAREYREQIHREALKQARMVHPEITEVYAKNPTDTYFANVWDYPGQWYLYVAIPEQYRTKKDLIDDIVKDTIERHRQMLAELPAPKRQGFFRRLFSRKKRV